MSSVAGIKPSRLYIYSITKAAIIKMTEAMARDFGQYNIRVNAIAPGRDHDPFQRIFMENTGSR